MSSLHRLIILGIMNANIFALPLLAALVYLIARSKTKGKAATFALGSMVVCFVLMFLLISIVPTLDTRFFGMMMGYVSLLVGVMTALFYDRKSRPNSIEKR